MIDKINSNLSRLTVICTLVLCVIIIPFAVPAIWLVQAPDEGDFLSDVIGIVLGLFAFFGGCFSLIIVSFAGKSWLGNVADMRTYLFLGSLITVAASGYILFLKYLAPIFVFMNK